MSPKQICSIPFGRDVMRLRSRDRSPTNPFRPSTFSSSWCPPPFSLPCSFSSYPYPEENSLLRPFSSPPLTALNESPSKVKLQSTHVTPQQFLQE